MNKHFEYKVGKKTVTFAAGLHWIPLVPDTFKSEFPRVVADLQRDLYVYRKSNKSIAGFSDTAEGGKPGMVALGLLIISYLEERRPDVNALIAIPLPGKENQCLYFTVRDGYLTPTGDVVGDTKEIERNFREESAVDGWNFLFCPSEWRIHQSEELTLDEVIRGANSGSSNYPKVWKLKPTKAGAGASLIKAAIGLVLIYLAFYAFSVWRASEHEKELRRIAAEQAAVQEHERQERLNAAPWDDMKSPHEFASACEEAMQKVGLIVGTWEVHDFECKGDTYRITWERASPVSWVRVMRELHSGVQITVDGGLATLVTKLNFSAEEKKKEPLPDIEKALDYLHDLPNENPITFTFKAIQQPSPPPGVPVEPLPWKGISVQAQTELGLSTYANLTSVPGFKLTRISGKYQKGVLKYEIEGAQYGKVQ